MDPKMSASVYKPVHLDVKPHSGHNLGVISPLATIQPEP
jgi:hypothetical protein